MKKRRVEQQDGFVALALHHQQRLYSCLWRASSAAGVNWRSMRQCVPLELSTHNHFDKFIYSINKLVSAGEDATDKCFLASPVGASLNSSSLQPASFLAEACMGKYARERLPSQQQAFLDDIASFTACAGTLLDTGAQGAVQNLARAVRKCLKVTLGISRHYVYRSLYVAQLHTCFKSVPRSDVLVLPSERLLHQPRETLADIMGFIGVPADHIERALRRNNSSGTCSSNSNSSSDEIMSYGMTGELVQKYFPKFERSTGWRLRSDYAPPPAPLTDALQAFFAPHNEQLFELLRTQPFPEWRS